MQFECVSVFMRELVCVEWKMCVCVPNALLGVSHMKNCERNHHSNYMYIRYETVPLLYTHT